MSDKSPANASRRDFLKNSGRIAGAAALVGAAGRHVYADGDETIRVALVGCGGRGTGAADNAMSVQAGRVELVAMADVFDDRQSTSFNALKNRHADRFKVTDDTRFIGFDAYKKAMDVLRPGDIVILTTPVVFRWVHYSYAIEKGLNVFMEKPITTEGPTTRKMLELNKKAIEKNLKVGVGLMCRHCLSRGEAAKRIHDGAIGDVLNIRAYRMAGPTGSAATGPAPDGVGDLEWQIRRFHAFLWASGGAVSDFLIHNIDEGCWLKNAWPVQAKGSGGRHFRGEDIDQNFDSYSIEYTFEDGTKMNVNGRTIPGCHQDFATYAQGTKGSVIFSTAGHVPAKSRIFSGYKVDKGDGGTDNDKLVWAYDKPEPNPYQVEWEDIVTAIKNDTPYNEVERGAMASLVTAMGRFAAHTGQVVTLDEMLNHEHEFAPDADKLVLGGPAPLAKLPNGKYPIPMPGITKKREY
jgi:predicted dehydrogenase